MNNSVLITGATGYVGAHLTNELVKHHDVHAILREKSLCPELLDNKKVNFHIYDGTVNSMIDILNLVKPNMVFHLASLFLSSHSSEQVSGLVQSNITFGVHLLEAMSLSGTKRMINTGTSWQHFENNVYNPVNLYAATKQAFEDILEYYKQAHGFKFVTLKLFDTYGPGDWRPKIFKLLDEHFEKGQTLNMSSGEQYIDLVYIEDVISAYKLAFQKISLSELDLFQSYAISSGTHIKLKDLVAAYELITERKLSINWGGRPYRNREVMTPWNTGKVLPGWSPKVDLYTGLKLIKK